MLGDKSWILIGLLSKHTILKWVEKVAHVFHLDLRRVKHGKCGKRVLCFACAISKWRLSLFLLFIQNALLHVTIYGWRILYLIWHQWHTRYNIFYTIHRAVIFIYLFINTCSFSAGNLTLLVILRSLSLFLKHGSGSIICLLLWLSSSISESLAFPECVLIVIIFKFNWLWTFCPHQSYIRAFATTRGEYLCKSNIYIVHLQVILQAILSYTQYSKATL